MQIVLDLCVIDHLQKVDAGTYRGKAEAALRKLRAAAEGSAVGVWICEISLVEMLHGIEKLAADSADPAKQAHARNNDTAKQLILKNMSARRLGYPCSKYDDDFSRLDISLRYAGPDLENAEVLESQLLTIAGVSRGDARQLVSCAYPFDGEDVGLHPRLDWFVTEDGALLAAIRSLAAGQFPTLHRLRYGTASDLVVSHPEVF
jgi:hypothetical protein